MKNNKFTNDTERIEELKLCLEQVLQILKDEEDASTAATNSKTLVQDVLSRYDEDKKFLTAKTIEINNFEYLTD